MIKDCKSAAPFPDYQPGDTVTHKYYSCYDGIVDSIDRVKGTITVLSVPKGKRRTLAFRDFVEGYWLKTTSTPVQSSPSPQSFNNLIGKFFCYDCDYLQSHFPDPDAGTGFYLQCTNPLSPYFGNCSLTYNSSCFNHSIPQSKPNPDPIKEPLK